MNPKVVLMTSATIGSIAGAYVPALWGDSSGLSAISLLLGFVGGILGLVAGWKFIQYTEN